MTHLTISSLSWNSENCQVDLNWDHQWSVLQNCRGACSDDIYLFTLWRRWNPRQPRTWFRNGIRWEERMDTEVELRRSRKWKSFSKKCTKIKQSFDRSKRKISLSGKTRNAIDTALINHFRQLVLRLQLRLSLWENQEVEACFSSMEYDRRTLGLEGNHWI